MELLVLLLLILLNGVFAMSEIAVVSARRPRLLGMADQDKAGARAAVELQEQPGGFLSTIQVGITSIAILSGAIGEAALAEPLRVWLSAVPVLAPWADVLALALVVGGIAYLSVVIGELVPKQLALLAPEAIAAGVARPLRWLSRAALPLVWLLSASSALILRGLGAKRAAGPPVTDEEIKVLMTQGAEAGVFHASEGPIVANILRLDEQSIRAIMTPRNAIDHLDLADPPEVLHRELAASSHGLLPVCRGGLDGPVLGLLKVADLLPTCLDGRPPDQARIQSLLYPARFVPEGLSSTQLLEQFRDSRVNLLLVVDEYGSLEGLVTLADLLGSIVGGPVGEDATEDPQIVRRADGSWLIDGGLSLERLHTALGLPEPLPDEQTRLFHTVSGFVMHMLGQIPRPADGFEAAGLRFEVMDMDRQRVDKVLVTIDPRADSGSMDPSPDGRGAGRGHVE
ncbi:HlyC/CorC family transporter [Thiohalocapsa marina]|uniref:HlyC/CorC family transporter n=1 Tax=Thiohalocapsa marina TaxID=424902 RepID=A0A5M8FUB8_9GAMM|nr:hemolysin family protein [Thiohalocapsa marina]KAA6187396.1 HlyC/CorC family transporter [Thiohalocapsa marina]